MVKRVIVTIAMAACGGSAPPPAAPAPTAPVAAPNTAGATSLTITELKFYDGDQLGVQLHANGKLEVKMARAEKGKPAQESWIALAQLSPDGKVTHDGQAIGELQPDGTFIADGKPQPFKLDGDALVVGDKRITLDEHGVLQGGTSGHMRVEGLTDAGSRRTALFVLALLESGSDEH